MGVLRITVWRGYLRQVSAGAAPRQAIAVLPQVGRPCVVHGAAAGAVAVAAGWLLKHALVRRAL
jgi:hypothetical protein